MDLISEIWHGKKVLITGHTGFKGSWLVLFLKELGAQITGLSLPPENLYPLLYHDAKISKLLFNEYFLDIRNDLEVKKVIQKSAPDYVFHLAAQALVRRSVVDPLESISTNILGTTNVLLSALSQKSLQGLVIATTDKVYQNINSRIPFKESDRLGGKDPYSASKASTELVVSALKSKCNPNNIPIVTVRAGNVIGGGDWGEDRLIPDLVKALHLNRSLQIRNPYATRPWQHVLDCLYGYLLTAQAFSKNISDLPDSINFGPSKSLSVSEVIRIFEKEFGNKINVVQAGSNIEESKHLELNSQLAKKSLNWNPYFTPEIAIAKTAIWYNQFFNGNDAQALMLKEIKNYMRENQ